MLLVCLGRGRGGFLSVSLLVCLSVCLSSLQIFSNPIINTRNLTPLKTFTNTLQPCLTTPKRRKWGWGKQGVGGCSQFLWSQASHSLKTHSVRFSARPPWRQEPGVSDLLWGYGCWSQCVRKRVVTVLNCKGEVVRKHTLSW